MNPDDKELYGAFLKAFGRLKPGEEPARQAAQGRPTMSTFKVLPDFEDAMAAVKDYARDWPGGDYRADFEAAATEVGWTDLQKTKTEFVIALVEAMCDLREKPH